MNQKKEKPTALLVFTDLDGSLMEHESYSIEPARGALESLFQRHYMVIMNSSKTAAEMCAVQQQIDLQAPFICENGAALQLLADGQVKSRRVEFGQPRDQWLPKVHSLREQHSFDFSGFADWSTERISELTGLDRHRAMLAAKREYSEPILWRGSTQQKSHFEKLLAAYDLQMLEGGRFLSIQGQHNKSDAMRWLKEHQDSDDHTLTVALGDSPNDTAMLAAADIAVIIKSAKSDRIQLDGPARVIRTNRPGPSGWSDAIIEILRTV